MPKRTKRESQHSTALRTSRAKKKTLLRAPTKPASKWQASGTLLRELAALVQTVHRLRAPGGCPWDRAQTHQSLRPYLIEEAYELLCVLDQVQSARDLRQEEIKTNFIEELGDVLLQVVLHAEMARESGAFDLGDVARTLREKLVRRHPHVFSLKNKASRAFSREKVQSQWEAVKAEEKAKKGTSDRSVLSGLPPSLPALQKAARVIQKVTKVGFQWPDFRGPLAKLDEEIGELKREIESLNKLERSERKDAKKIASLRARLEAELGDVLFCVANLSYLLKVEPEQALRGNLARFERRFRHVENSLRVLGKRPEESSLEEMDRFWKEAKAAE